MNNTYFLLSRNITNNDIWISKPAWWLKVFIYLISKASYKDTNELKKGEVFLTYEQIYFDCKLSKEGVKKRAIDNVIRALKSNDTIETQKTTRGFYVKLCNYSKYQDFSFYKNDTENDSQCKNERHYNIKHINNKNIKEKNIKKENFKKPEIEDMNCFVRDFEEKKGVYLEHLNWLKEKGVIENEAKIAMNDFYYYWAETDQKGVMFWQTKKTFSVRGRLRTWINNKAKKGW